MKTRTEAPFSIGDKVSWERDGERKVGIVYAVEWIKSDDGFWKISASWNGEPFHPIVNRRGEFLEASSRRFTKEQQRIG